MVTTSAYSIAFQLLVRQWTLCHCEVATQERFDVLLIRFMNLHQCPWSHSLWSGTFCCRCKVWPNIKQLPYSDSLIFMNYAAPQWYPASENVPKISKLDARCIEFPKSAMPFSLGSSIWQDTSIPLCVLV